MTMKKRTIDAAKTVTDLTGLSTRCYEDGQLIYFTSQEEYPEGMPDLFAPYIDRLEEFRNPIGYVQTKDSVIFGVVNNDPVHFVIGPILSKQFSSKDLDSVVDQLALDEETAQTVRAYLENSKHLSPQSVIPILMNLYMVFRFKEVDTTFDVNKDSTLVTEEFSFLDASTENEFIQNIEISDFFDEIITSGDVEGMTDWLANATSMRFCPDVSASALRNTKNSFLIASTLASRSAVRGGLDKLYSIKIHQKYIEKSETAHSTEEVYKLTQQMFLDYTEKVSKLKRIDAKTNLVSDALNYIHSHLYMALRTEDIAKALFVSRAYLSTMFHSETGKTISSYIRDEKIGEAKKLLRRTEQPLSLISTELGFSSQSYFTRVFKQVTGVTPNDYRNKV